MSETTSYSFHTNTLHGKVVAGFVLTAGVGLLLAPESFVPDHLLLSLVLFVGGGAVLVMTVRTAADKRPRMTVSDKGIWFRDWDLDVVPWGEIRKVYMTGIRIKITICVELRNSKGFVATMSPAHRSRLKTNSLIRLPVLRIPPKVLNAPVDEVLAALKSGLAP